MNIWDKIWELFTDKTPETFYKVIITNELVSVEHPKHGITKIKWNQITRINLINLDIGPAGIDIWMSLIGEDEVCLIPHGHAGFEKVYEIVSKYKNFNFENFINSMGCTDNVEFLLWEKEN